MSSDKTSSEILTQECAKCETVKPVTEFSRNKARKSGFSHLCRVCEREKNKSSYDKHAQKRREYATEYREEHKDEKSDYNKAYREAHREELNSYTKNWRLTHKAKRSPESLERQRQERKRRYAEDAAYKAEVKRRAKKYRDENPEKVKSAMRAWQQNNREHTREYMRQYRKTWKTPEEMKQYEKKARARYNKKHAAQKIIEGANRRSRRGELPGEFSNEHLYWLFKWQDNKCFFCNIELNEHDNHERPVEHIIPAVIEGSTNWPHNIVRSCGHCNYTRQNKFFSTEWMPEPKEVIPADRFHSTYCLGEMKKELEKNNVQYEVMADHILVGGRPIFMLSSFWMSSRVTPIETLETIRSKHPNSVMFFDHEWIKSKDAVSNIVLAKAGLSEQFGARELEVDIPTFDEAKEFMSKWHIQGFAGGTWIIGLRKPGIKDDDSWRAMAIFRSTKNGYELSRMAFRAHVTGGLSRIISAFKKIVPEQKQIFSFCDLRFGDGGGYLATGFKSTGDSMPIIAYANCIGLFHWYIAKRQNLERRLDYYDPNLSEIENLRVNGVFRMTLLPRKKFIMPA